MDPAQLLAAYDDQVRRGLAGDGSGARIEADGPVVRWVAVDGRGWSGISWSQLADAATADAVIARQVMYFRGLGQPFEWKLYDYDQPADLDNRLAAAGFTPGPAEALLVAVLARGDDSPEPPDRPSGRGLAQGGMPALPDGVGLQPVSSDADVAALIGVHQQVFGGEHAQLRSSLLAQLHQVPETTAMVLAVAGGDPVSSARIDFPPGTEFAGLCGGGTVPAWRGRGIYRALVAYRARLAAERGYRYLSVDASAGSEPILRRLGFRVLAQTTPYRWTG